MIRVFSWFLREKEKTRIFGQGLESESFHESFPDGIKIAPKVSQTHAQPIIVFFWLKCCLKLKSLERDSKKYWHRVTNWANFSSLPHFLGANTGLFGCESFFRKLGLWLESDSDESSTRRPKDSRSSEHDLFALDPTLPSRVLCIRRPEAVFTRWTMPHVVF